MVINIIIFQMVEMFMTENKKSAAVFNLKVLKQSEDCLFMNIYYMSTMQSFMKIFVVTILYIYFYIFLHSNLYRYTSVEQAVLKIFFVLIFSLFLILHLYFQIFTDFRLTSSQEYFIIFSLMAIIVSAYNGR